jgi:sugar phosphate isomerase/epimerase
MRLGMSGAFLPTKIDDFSEETCRRIKELGFSGCFTRFTDNPLETDHKRAHRVRDLMKDQGVRMYQAIGYRPPLHHPDENVRKEAVRILSAAVRLNAALGARGTHTGPGSLNPKGAWYPHPYNWTQQAKDQLIKSLREVAPVAEDSGIYVGMEGHVLVTLNSAETMRDVLAAVNSPRIKCDLDPVNWITLDTIYDTRNAVRHMAKTLEGFMIGGHSKDVIIEDKLVTHITETSTGLGLLDYDAFLPLIEAIDTDFPLLVEHCPTDDLPRISAFLHGKCKELGIPILS